MDNKINSGSVITYTASADIAAGDLVNLGAGLVGVAVADIANGATGAVEVRGRFTVPKASAAAMTVGKLLKLGTAGNTVALATAGSSVTAMISARVAKASTTASTTVDIILGL